MKLKIIILSVVIMAWPVYTEAQSARNPLNLEPARVMIQKRISSWKLAEETFYHANGTQFDKRSYVYDENGRQTAELTLHWNKADKAWQNAMQTDYLYENGKEIVLTKSDRQNPTKTEIISGADGKPFYSLSFPWNKNVDGWSANPSLRSEWVYDNNGLVKACLKQYKNKESNEWDDFSVRILYSYDRDGLLNEELFQVWSKELEQWVDKGKYSYSNDSEQCKTAVSYFYASDRWIVDGKTNYIYDEEGKIARCEFFNHTDEALAAYSLFTYSEGVTPPVAVESADINVYPNPAVSSFELAVPETFLGKILQLYNVSGELVKSIPIPNQRTQVDVSRLPKGIYMLKISNVTKRLIIQ